MAPELQSQLIAAVDKEQQLLAERNQFDKMYDYDDIIKRICSSTPYGIIGETISIVACCITVVSVVYILAVLN